jgi:hypothetical protein
MVLHALLLTHDRIKAFSVEVAIVDLMAARLQGRDDRAVQRRAKAGANGICV